jgi:hypothetical protein
METPVLGDFSDFSDLLLSRGQRYNSTIFF